MSGAVISSYAAVAGALNAVSTVMFALPRSIGQIIPHCAFEERHLDRLAITSHPVERGANTVDHVFKQPTEITLRWAWSNAGQGEGFVQQVYETLLALQDSRQPFVLTTGKKQYRDMLLTSLLVTTDGAAETALFVTATCQNLIFVDTQAATAPPLPADSQRFPQQTASVTASGPQQAIPLKPTEVVPSMLQSLLNSSGLGGKDIAGLP